MRAAGQVVVPALTVTEAVTGRLGGTAGVSYDVARATVGQWYRAGVTILAGTASRAPAAPASLPCGSSLQHELELLVGAGMSPVDAVRSATVLAAREFGLADRGVIAPGMRADLVLVEGDPLEDISAVSKIAAVWCAGVPVAGTLSRTEETGRRSSRSRRGRSPRGNAAGAVDGTQAAPSVWDDWRLLPETSPAHNCSVTSPQVALAPPSSEPPRSPKQQGRQGGWEPRLGKLRPSSEARIVASSGKASRYEGMDVPAAEVRQCLRLARTAAVGWQ
jgi:Amidohydrolase family